MQTSTSPIVSFDDEDLILVDPQDQVQGHLSKAACHVGKGLLHRAFSVFLFNEKGELLLQQRSEQKRLWPGYWANSCCSHPRRGETVENAARRRTLEELNVQTPLRFAFRFTYHAQFGDIGAEHELCSVFVGKATPTVRFNVNEIAATRFVAPQELDSGVLDDSEPYAPWLRLEWPRLRRDHWDLVHGMIA